MLQSLHIKRTTENYHRLFLLPVLKVTLVQLNNCQDLLGKEGKSLPGSPPALSINEWKIQLLVETRIPKSRIHQGFGFFRIKRSF
jgi:hypothetical protein